MFVFARPVFVVRLGSISTISPPCSWCVLCWMLNANLHLKLRDAQRRFQVPLVLCPHQLGAVTGPTPKLLEAIFWMISRLFFLEKQTFFHFVKKMKYQNKFRISDFSFKFVPGRQCRIPKSKMQELDSPPKGVAVHHQDSFIQNVKMPYQPSHLHSVFLAAFESDLCKSGLKHVQKTRGFSSIENLASFALPCAAYPCTDGT